MQHINLYRQLEQKVELPFSARQQLGIVLAILVLMLANYVFTDVNRRSLQEEVEKLSREQASSEQQLVILNAKKQAQENNPQLAAEITSLEREVNFRRKLLSSIDSDDVSLEVGFSDHLTGLARQHIDGLWFTDIQLQKGGQQMALMGRSHKPEFLPQFLQMLSAEPIFAGQQFSVLKMSSTKEQRGALDFEVRGKEVGLP